MNHNVFRFEFDEWTPARVTTLVLAVSIAILSIVRGLVVEQARAYVEVAQSSTFVAIVLAVVWRVSRTDEFVRRYWSQAAVFGFVVGLLGLSVLDALRAAGIYDGTLGNPRRAFVLPFAAALVFFTLRYRWCRNEE